MPDLPLAVWALIIWAAIVVFCLGWMAWAFHRAPRDTELWLGGDPDARLPVADERPDGVQDRRQQ